MGKSGKRGNLSFSSADAAKEDVRMPFNRRVSEKTDSAKETQSQVALVHDWLNGMRGGEAVFDALLELHPAADVFTLIYEPEKLSQALQEKLSRTRVYTPWIARLSLFRKHYRVFLPLLPVLAALMPTTSYRLIVSSSHCVAKNVRKGKNSKHLCYIHAPMRYMWTRFDDYFGAGRASSWVRIAALLFRPLLQGWDRATARHVDRFVANSAFIAEQVRRFYGQEAAVVHPFADLSRFRSRPKHERENFYLMVGALAPYKRADQAIEALGDLQLPLKVVGSGQDQRRLFRSAQKKQYKSVEFLGSLSNKAIEDLYSRARAFVFPGIEDFGITPIEALASGTPVIAFGAGGACETVGKDVGILYFPQTVEALKDAVRSIEVGAVTFSATRCVESVQGFTRARFLKEMGDQLSSL
jgi:glycosyltransferase involved in cell wall biosynthesis